MFPAAVGVECGPVHSAPVGRWPARGAVRSYWSNLVKAAVLGTEHQARPQGPPSGQATGVALGELIARIDSATSDDPAAALLARAVVVGLHRQAGMVPAAEAVRAGAIVPCTPEDQPRCGPQAAGHLRMMLAGRCREALPEWLGAARSASRGVPEECVPDLLEIARKNRELRAVVLSVCGRRGAWLAAQNPVWNFATAAGDVALWQIGTQAERLALLSELRRSNPPAGGELLASTWDRETPEDRAAFLQLFSTGLSPADEPLLEKALDDRRKEVRKTGADLLSRMPQSQLCQRMTQRLRPLLAFEAGRKGIFRKGKDTLNVALPGECDKAMIRDGIEPKPPQGAGEKAWWLMHMLAAVPPSTWSQAWSITPAQLVDLAAAGEWKQPLLVGWVQAAGRFADVPWAGALTQVTLSGRKNGPGDSAKAD